MKAFLKQKARKKHNTIALRVNAYMAKSLHIVLMISPVWFFAKSPAPSKRGKLVTVATWHIAEHGWSRP